MKQLNVTKVKLITILGLFFLTLFKLNIVFANDELKQVEDNLRKVNDGAFAQAPIEVFDKLDLPGFEQLYLASVGGQSLVVDKTGTFAVAGKLINLDKRLDLGASYINKKLSKKAQTEIAKLTEDDFVTFPAKKESIGQLYVLTDPTCSYCQKLHTEIEALQTAGVEVKYIPYPRGPLSDGETAYEQTKQIMCARDKQDAMDKIKRGRDSGMFEQAQYAASCIENIRKGKALGNALEIAGTPFLYLSTGDIVKGYQPPEALLAYFNKD